MANSWHIELARSFPSLPRTSKKEGRHSSSIGRAIERERKKDIEEQGDSKIDPCRRHGTAMLLPGTAAIAAAAAGEKEGLRLYSYSYS